MEGESMSEWKLLDLCIGKGKYGIAAPAVPRNNNLPTYLRITDINDDGTVNKGSLCSVEDENSKNYILKENDIVFARTGNSTGRSYFYNKNDGELVYAGFLIKFSLNPNIVNPMILKYYTHSKPYYDWIHSFDTGATRGNINAQTYANMPVVLPEKNVQDIIVHILSSLDAKIETNNKLNEKLEEMAQAIFKSWFVDFEPFKDRPFHETELGMIPEGWEVGSILDIAELFDYQRKPLSSMEREYMKGKYPYYGATSIMDYIDKYIFDGTYLLMGEDGSVVKENGNPYLQYVWGKFWPNNHAHVMQGRNGFSTEMLYCLLSITDVSSIVTGAVQMKISQRSMSRLLTVIPSKSVCKKFNKIIRPIFDIIKRIREENDRLASLRDTLLPRLMSGEIKI